MNFDEAKQSEYVPEQPPEEVSVPEMQGKAFGGGEYTGDENDFQAKAEYIARRLSPNPSKEYIDSIRDGLMNRD